MEMQVLQFEDDIRRNPYNLKAWIRYTEYLTNSAPTKRYIVYERSLKFLPRSYKLWNSYLLDRLNSISDTCKPNDQKYFKLINTFERALIHMHKMPKIWLNYCNFLSNLGRGSQTRRAFDRALQALPITQHKKIWEDYIIWAKYFGVKETVIKVYTRFLMFDSSIRESFITYLEEIHQYDETVRQLIICIDDEHFISRNNMTKYQMWMKICDICASNPLSIGKSFNIESIIRSGISRFSDEVGKLWCKLADFYIRQGQFEKGRDIFEEAISTVITVRDFIMIFDAYVKVEESIVTEKLMENQKNGNRNEDDINIRLARLENLMDKRPILVNSVVLRQNPNNVFEWHKRVKLYKNDSKKVLLTYVEALKSVDSKLATGKLSTLWMSFARYYERMGDFENAREVFLQASEVAFKATEEIATVWCAWSEMEVKIGNYDRALAILKQAVSEPVSTMQRRKSSAASQGQGIRAEPANTTAGASPGAASDRLHKNVKVWSMYLDLEESFGTVSSCKAAYERIMDLKIITTQIVLNYASFLERNLFFEDSFKVYEQAINLFNFPQLKAIWENYLDSFVRRYAGSKLERLRDLFEQAIEKVPEDLAAEFFIRYAKVEEQFGLQRHAMAVYDRATRAVLEGQKVDMYRLYIKKIEVFFGVTKARPVYERAVKELQEDAIRAMCMEYADMERKLGEIDRARLILQHGAHIADPRKEAGYWRFWKEFEEMHGNEDTFRDMLRVQRSVESAFSQVNYLAAEMIAGETIASATVSDLEAMAKQAESLALFNSKKILAGSDKDERENTKRKYESVADLDLDSSSNKIPNTGDGAGVDTEVIDIDNFE